MTEHTENSEENQEQASLPAQDRDLAFYFIADGNMRQARGVLVDQDEATLDEWWHLTDRFRQEIRRALTYVRAAADEEA